MNSSLHFVSFFAALIGSITSATAQEVRIPAGFAPGVSVGYGAPETSWTPVDADHPMPTAAKQEVVSLVAANLPAGAQSVYGGDYLFGQSCVGYGTVALQVLSANGTSFQTLIARTSTDTVPVGLAIGSNAVVKVDLTGTSGCAANLSRVP